MMFIFTNDGQAITGTNYWDSEHARRGFAFMSWNAGAGRLLLPDPISHMLREMRDAQYVIVSRGPWHEHGGRDALELLFEDGSDSPFCLHLVAEQTDRLLPQESHGSGFTFTVWTREGKQLRLPGKYRIVPAIPCLAPWSVQ